jgi:hypothetical protein
MARSPRSTSSKAPTGRKARAGGAASTKTRASAGTASKKNAGPGKGPARQPRAASKRTQTRARPGRGQPQAGNWAAGVSSLLTSELGREILADMLNAAAGILRQHRGTDQQAQEAGQGMADRGTDLASTAVQVGTEAASGAVDAGAEITAAAVDIAQTAAGTLATVATGAVLNMLPSGSTADNEGQKGRRRRRASKSGSEPEEDS